MVRVLVALVLMSGCSWGTPTPIVEPEPAEPEMVNTTLQVDSMKECNRCAMNVRMAIREHEGVERVHLNIKTGVVVVTHDKSVLAGDVLVAAAAKAKQTAVVVSEGPPGPPPNKAAKAPGSDATDHTDTPADTDASGQP